MNVSDGRRCTLFDSAIPTLHPLRRRGTLHPNTACHQTPDSIAQASKQPRFDFHEVDDLGADYQFADAHSSTHQPTPPAAAYAQGLDRLLARLDRLEARLADTDRRARTLAHPPQHEPIKPRRPPPASSWDRPDFRHLSVPEDTDVWQQRTSWNAPLRRESRVHQRASYLDHPPDRFPPECEHEFRKQPTCWDPLTHRKRSQPATCWERPTARFQSDRSNSHRQPTIGTRVPQARPQQPSSWDRPAARHSTDVGQDYRFLRQQSASHSNDHSSARDNVTMNVSSGLHSDSLEVIRTMPEGVRQNADLSISNEKGCGQCLGENETTAKTEVENAVVFDAIPSQEVIVLSDSASDSDSLDTIHAEFPSSQPSNRMCNACVVDNGQQHFPIQIGASPLTKLKPTADDFLGKLETPAVISLTNYFSDAPRQAIKCAGMIAVFDLGDALFNVSILEIAHAVMALESRAHALLLQYTNSAIPSALSYQIWGNIQCVFDAGGDISPPFPLCFPSSRSLWFVATWYPP